MAEATSERADRRPMFALFGAEGISQIGNTMTVVARPWFVLQTTGSAARTGIVGAALAIGAVLPAVLGGPLVDRLGFKRASVLAVLICAATIAAVPVLHLAGVLAFWHLLVLVFLLSSVNSQGDTARFALVPFLAGRALMPIEQVNATDRAVVRLGQVVGPLVAGGLIVAVGPRTYSSWTRPPFRCPRSSWRSESPLPRGEAAKTLPGADDGTFPNWLRA